MYIFFSIAFIAFSVIFALFIAELNPFAAEPKPMLEQIAEAQLQDEADYKGQIIDVEV